MCLIMQRKNGMLWKLALCILACTKGSGRVPELLPETTRSVRSDTWGELCRDTGVDTTAEATSKRNLSSFVSKRLPVSGCIV
jgi:hypothetical protein